jgi:hypothetical protein
MTLSTGGPKRERQANFDDVQLRCVLVEEEPCFPGMVNPSLEDREDVAWTVSGT